MKRRLDGVHVNNKPLDERRTEIPGGLRCYMAIVSVPEAKILW